MQITGKILLINTLQEIGSSGFRKREVVVQTEEQYPQTILIEFVQDKCDLLNSYKVGQDVKISINLRGREWINPQGETKYFNSIQGWRIEFKTPKDISGNLNTMPEPLTTSFVNLPEDEDLPF